MATPQDGSRAKPFIVRKGGKFRLKATIALDGRAINLASPIRTGTGYMRVAGDQHSAGAVSAATLAVAITSAGRGEVEITLGATVTATLAAGLYVGAIQMTDTGTPNPDDVIVSPPFYLKVEPGVRP